MGGGHEDLFKNFYVRDWRSYKLKDAPRLHNLQNMLHREGLHDPWLRNYVWMFTKEGYDIFNLRDFCALGTVLPLDTRNYVWMFTKEGYEPRFNRYWFQSMSPGLKTAIGLVAATILIRKLNQKYHFYGKPDAHHDEH